MSDAAELAELWMDTTCKAVFPRTKTRLRFTGEPVIVREPRKLWQANPRLYIRYKLQNMPPESRTVIEGVTVELYSSKETYKMYYAVRGVKADSLDDAVNKVIQHIQGGT